MLKFVLPHVTISCGLAVVGNYIWAWIVLVKGIEMKHIRNISQKPVRADVLTEIISPILGVLGGVATVGLTIFEIVNAGQTKNKAATAR